MIIKKNKLFLESAFYSIGNMVGAGLNLFYQFILILFISFNDYGVIQPMLQFIGLLLLPVSAYQFALTKHLSSLESQNVQQEFAYRIQQLIKIIAVVTLLWIMLIPVWQKIFHIDNTLIFILLLLSIIMNMLLTPYMCRLQADKNFFIAGIVQIIQGITRISLGIICVYFAPNIWGAMCGILLSNLAGVFTGMFNYRKNLGVGVKISTKITPMSLKSLFVSLGSVGLFSLLVYSDIILVRILLPNESALFASSNLLGKGMLFLTTGISFVVLPLMAEKLHDSSKALWVGFGCLLILVISYVGFFYFTAPFLETILFKNEATVSGIFQKFMPYYNMMFIPFPLIYYFLNFYIVKENVFYPVILAFASITLYIGIIINANNIYAITKIIGIVGYLVLLIVLIHTYIHEKQSKQKNC